MEIFWRVILAYLINEFIIQRNFLAYWKSFTLKKILIHNGVFFLISLLLTFPLINTTWVSIFGINLNGGVSLLVITFLFTMQDIWRIYTLKNFKSLDNTIYFLWDQFVHFMVVFALCPVSGFEKTPLPFDEKIVALISIFVIVSYGLTVFIYFMEKDFYLTEFPGTDEKYLTMLQRVVLWLFFLIPGFYWILFLVLWIFYSFYLIHKRVLDFGRFGIYAGFILTIIIALTTRYIYFFQNAS